MIVVNPYAPLMGSLVVGTANPFIPWLAISSSTISQPYAGATISPGPFYSGVSNYVSQYTDISNISFECTLAPLNCSGAVISTVFYNAPNEGLNLLQGNTVNLSTATITTA